jgi:diguanylate cyclase (GGDEF)-like protein
MSVSDGSTSKEGLTRTARTNVLSKSAGLVSRGLALLATPLLLSALEALAFAIGAKDQKSPAHLSRVRLHAVTLARALGMRDSDVEGVEVAAILHNIGMLAVPEYILSKSGPLTPDEFQQIRAHPQAGADIISAVPFPYPVSALILSHHERWDGKGYPAGLKGEEIPLGARILSVVDYFDALMAERPYHKGMTAEAAIDLLQHESGKGLDPLLVTKFIELLPSLEHAAGYPGSESSPKSVFDDIARAHIEFCGLFEIAQAMGTGLGVSDTMTALSSKLIDLVPFACAALFVFEEETETLRCRFAAGTEADVIQQIVVRSGDGLTGWAARNRRPLVNARPSADLEASGLTHLSTTLESALVSPLMLNERLIGTLSVYHTDSAFYRDHHRRLLGHVSAQAAAVINNSLLFEQTQEDSLTDTLTGLPNTRFMFMYLARELPRVERLKSEVALLVILLEDLSGLNKEYGRFAVDRALCEIARVLRAAIRPYDIAVRYEGGEFIVVLTGCGAQEAEQKRLEIKRSIVGLHVEGKTARPLILTVSAGAAIFPHDGETYEALLGTADSRRHADTKRR